MRFFFLFQNSFAQVHVSYRSTGASVTSGVQGRVSSGGFHRKVHGSACRMPIIRLRLALCSQSRFKIKPTCSFRKRSIGVCAMVLPSRILGSSRLLQSSKAVPPPKLPASLEESVSIGPHTACNVNDDSAWANVSRYRFPGRAHWARVLSGTFPAQTHTCPSQTHYSR